MRATNTQRLFQAHITLSPKNQHLDVENTEPLRNTIKLSTKKTSKLSILSTTWIRPSKKSLHITNLLRYNSFLNTQKNDEFKLLAAYRI